MEVVVDLLDCYQQRQQQEEEEEATTLSGGAGEGQRGGKEFDNEVEPEVVDVMHILVPRRQV